MKLEVRSQYEFHEQYFKSRSTEWKHCDGASAQFLYSGKTSPTEILVSKIVTRLKYEQAKCKHN